jgi:hypothetical protein
MQVVFQRFLYSMRGGRRPRQLVPAVVLGALAGAVCGWNLSFALLVLGAILLNGLVLPTCLAAAAGAGLAWSGASLVQMLGVFVLDKLGLAGAIEALGGGPFVVLLGWSDYQLVGAALAALAVALPVAHASSRRTASAGLAGHVPFFRPYGWLPATIWIVIVASLPYTVGPRLVGQALLDQLSAAAGAPATAEVCRYDLFCGRLQLENVRLGDAADAGRVALRIDRVAAEVDPGLFLRGRLRCDTATFSGLHFDATSQIGTPTKLFPNEPTFLREGEAAVREPAPTQPCDVADYLRDWRDVEIRLATLGRLIAAVEGITDLEQPHSAAGQRLEASRHPAVTPRDPLSDRSEPLVSVKKLRLDDLPADWGLGRQAYVELSQLASRPTSSSRGTHLTLDDPTRNLQATLEFRFANGSRKHDLSLSWLRPGCGDLVDGQRLAGAGVDASQTQLASLKARGWASRERVELPLSCEIRGVRLTSSPVRFGGIDFAVWREGVARLGGLRFDAVLTGRWTDPHLQVVPAAFVDQLKHQLRAAGEHALVDAVTTGRLPTSLANATATPPATTNTASVAPQPIAPIAASPIAVTVASGEVLPTAATRAGTAPPVAQPTVPRPTANVPSPYPTTPAAAPSTAAGAAKTSEPAPINAPPAPASLPVAGSQIVTKNPAFVSSSAPQPASAPAVASNVFGGVGLEVKPKTRGVAATSAAPTLASAPTNPVATSLKPTPAAAVPSTTVAKNEPTSVPESSAAKSAASSASRPAAANEAAVESKMAKSPLETVPAAGNPTTSASVAATSKPTADATPRVASPSKSDATSPASSSLLNPGPLTTIPDGTPQVAAAKSVATSTASTTRLRQPAGILQPSAKPALADAPKTTVAATPKSSTNAATPTNSPTPKSTTTPTNTIAAMPREELPPRSTPAARPVTDAQAARQPAAPIASRGTSPEDASSEAPAAKTKSDRPVLNMLTGWMTGGNTTSAEPPHDRYAEVPDAGTVFVPKSQVAAAPASASKPWFPKVRSFFVGEPAEAAGSTTGPSESIAADRPSSRRGSMIPETARQPQNGRSVR